MKEPGFWHSSGMALRLALILAATMAGRAGVAGGSALVVSPAGAAGAAGTVEAPLASIQEGLDRARAGDTVIVKAGVYRERVRFRQGGDSGRPIVLQGEPGAILDASDSVPLDWQPATDIAAGVYRAALSNAVSTVTAGGKIVTMLDEARVNPERVRRVLANGKDPKARGVVAANVMDADWEWPRIFARGVGKSGWVGVKALAMYNTPGRELLVRFEGDPDPRLATMTVAPRIPAVTISNANHCVVRGLSIRNGWQGVFIGQSAGSIVEQCVMGPMDHGVHLDRGAERCTVRFNEIFMNPYSGASPALEGSWDNWLAHKVGGFLDRVGIEMERTLGGHEVHDNWIHDHWDGIEDKGRGDGENRDLNIHHNLIENLSDDGLEPNGFEENCRWHDNVVIGAICGFRIKSVRKGPLYAYRNIFFDNKEDYRVFVPDPHAAEVYVYHNTSSSRAALHSNKVQGIGAPNYHFFNNLFWCERWWSGGDLEPNWRGHGNVFVRRGTDARWETTREMATRLGIDQNSEWVEGRDPGFTDFEHRDVRLTEQSPARGKAQNPAEAFKRALPGCEPGYHRGERPDAGALQYGEPMPVLPRSPGLSSARPPAVFPGAMGWAAGTTTGGRGGRILRVTTLDRDGPGSIVEAMAAKGPRIVVFEVGGVIDLGGRTLTVTEPDLTIAGQTAPSPGIHLIRGGLLLQNTSNVVVRHIAVRSGECGFPKWTPGLPGHDFDCLSTDNARDIIIDHCSGAWASDECMSVSGPRTQGGTTVEDFRRNTSCRVTIQNCILAETLALSIHAKYKRGHSKGTLVHDNVTDVLLARNFYVSHGDRNPAAKAGARVAVVNNWIFNPGEKPMHSMCEKGEWGQFDRRLVADALAGKGAILNEETAAEGYPDYPATRLAFNVAEWDLGTMEPKTAPHP